MEAATEFLMFCRDRQALPVDRPRPTNSAAKTKSAAAAVGAGGAPQDDGVRAGADTAPDCACPMVCGDQEGLSQKGGGATLPTIRPNNS